MKDTRLVELIQKANELNFRLVYVIDNQAMNDNVHTLKPSTVQKKYGVLVADGVIPIDTRSFLLNDGFGE